MKDGLRQRVEVTGLGEFHRMPGLEIQHDRIGRAIHLPQRACIDTILRRFNFEDLKPLSTPMDVRARLTSEQSPKDVAEFAAMRDMPYREAIGALNWAALATHPDIAFAVAAVTRFAANPGPAHWEAVKRIYRYLSSTPNLWLSYGGDKAHARGLCRHGWGHGGGQARHHWVRISHRHRSRCRLLVVQAAGDCLALDH